MRQDFSTKNARRKNKKPLLRELDRQRRGGGPSEEQRRSAAEAMRGIHSVSH